MLRLLKAALALGVLVFALALPASALTTYWSNGFLFSTANNSLVESAGVSVAYFSDNFARAADGSLLITCVVGCGGSSVTSVTCDEIVVHCVGTTTVVVSGKHGDYVDIANAQSGIAGAKSGTWTISANSFTCTVSTTYCATATGGLNTGPIEFNTTNTTTCVATIFYICPSGTTLTFNVPSGDSFQFVNGPAAFQSNLTAAIVDIGNDNTGQDKAILIGAALGAGQNTQIGTNGANAVGPVSTTLFGIARQSIAWDLALDGSGNFAVRAAIAGAKSNGSNITYVSPVYNPGGTAVASTQHEVYGFITLSFNGACAADNTSCALLSNTATFTGAAGFTSATSYECDAQNENGSSIVSIQHTSATQITVNLGNPYNATIPNATSNTIDYSCRGT